MPKVLFIKDVEKVRVELAGYFTNHEDARFVRRLDMLALLCDHHPIPYVAKLFQVHPTTLERWVHRFNQSGPAGLRDQPGRGRRARLDQAGRDRLRAELSKPPSTYGYEQTTWSGKLLAHHLQTRYGVQLKVRRCQALFRQLGFSLQRPRKVPAGGDPEQRAAFKKNS